MDEYEQKLRVVQTAQNMARAEELLSAFSEKHPDFAEELAAIAALLQGREEQ